MHDFDSLIDVRCGDGRLLLEISKIFPDKTLLGTDFSATAISFANAFAPHLDIRAVTLEEMVNQKKLFSIGTLIEVLEHIPPMESTGFLQRFKSVIEPGGRALISVPSINVPLNPKHYRHFDENSLREILEPHFTILTVEYLNAEVWGEKILRRILANRFFILNEPIIVQKIYDYYRRHYLRATPQTGGRLVAVVQN